MSQDFKPMAKKFVVDVSKKIPLQYKHDQFMSDYLNRLKEKMEEANRGINEKVEALLLKNSGNQDVRKQLTSVLKMSMDSGNQEGVKELQEMLTSRSNIDAQLQALLGVVQYSILLASRIEVFRKIVELVIDAGSEDLDDEAMQVKLLKYGPQLQHVWQKAMSECRSMDERQMVSTNIFGKEIKLGGEA